MHKHVFKARTLLALAIVAAGLTLTGCATNRSEISLMAAPAANASASTPAAARGAIVLNSVEDRRVFEERPRDPSTPSVGTAGGGPETQARLIGRKRNAYGRALGDVILPANETVAGVMRENVRLALEHAGYSVLEASAAPAGTPTIDVSVTKFWAWFTPGAFAIKVDADVETQLRIAGAAEPVVISAHAHDERGAASENVWRQILQAGLAAYQTEAATKLAQPPLAPAAGS